MAPGSSRWPMRSKARPAARRRQRRRKTPEPGMPLAVSGWRRLPLRWISVYNLFGFRPDSIRMKDGLCRQFDLASETTGSVSWFAHRRAGFVGAPDDRYQERRKRGLTPAFHG